MNIKDKLIQNCDKKQIELINFKEKQSKCKRLSENCKEKINNFNKI